MTRRFSIAPMMEWTDRHYRSFVRQLTKRAFLYTEMVTTGAIIHGDRDRFLNFNECEHPVALQLGGSNPKDLATCAKYGEEWGYDEINLNVGCPSDRVQEGKIGACLIAEPQLVADCVQAMIENCNIPVTVKTRLGLDDNESYDDLTNFINLNQKAGCKLFTLHARNAWLKGLSPKKNRTIPPLKYDWVYQVKKDFSELHIELNGGIKSLDECSEHLKYVDSVMLGRAAYENIWILSEVDIKLHKSLVRSPLKSEALEKFSNSKNQTPGLRNISKHLNSLFNGNRGAKKWRQTLANIQKEDICWKDLITIAKEIEDMNHHD